MVWLEDPARQDRPVGLETLAGNDQAELVESAEGGQIGSGERIGALADGSVGHVEVFRLGWCRNPHLRETSTSLQASPRQRPLHPHLRRARLAHEPLGWRPTILEVSIRRYRCNECAHVWRQDTTPAAEPRAKLSRRGLRWALESIVVGHLTVARVAEGLGVGSSTSSNPVSVTVRFGAPVDLPLSLPRVPGGPRVGSTGSAVVNPE